jgi:hypothetical protein
MISKKLQMQTEENQNSIPETVKFLHIDPWWSWSVGFVADTWGKNR